MVPLLILMAATAQPAPPHTLVVGFLGGWNDPADARRGVTQTARALAKLPGVRAEAISNHDRKLAIAMIREAVEHDRDTRVILYGQSLGGAATVKAARELRKLGIPVLLTVQVDSVGLGSNDRVIPSNVSAAANFFQRESWPLIGRKEIRAADPAKTDIIGNYRYSYRGVKVDFPTEQWRILTGSHAKMERDPEVWHRVTTLISTKIEEVAK